MESLKDDLLKVEKLFDQIIKIFPDNSVNLTIHNIDMKEIDRDIWEIKASMVDESLRTFLSAKRKLSEEEAFDITLIS